MKIFLGFLAAFSLASAQHAEAPKTASPDAVLEQLLAGNSRYAADKLGHPRQTASRRTEVAKGQKPIAAVLGCADSRVPPEVVFDQGLGDLFVARVAGNVATDDIIASLEYAVAHLGPKLIVVLGHERCGAVGAAMQGGASEGHLDVLLDRIKPAVSAAKQDKGDQLDSAVKRNVANVVSQLKSSNPILAAKVKSGEIRIVGARYDLDSGKVELVK